eukprot:scaffold41094_cov24-Prasinocladus_malaysianus.AAC.1
MAKILSGVSAREDWPGAASRTTYRSCPDSGPLLRGETCPEHEIVRTRTGHSVRASSPRIGSARLVAL